MKKLQKEFKKSDKYYFDAIVVSRNIITDFIQGIRNFLGLELKGYTNIIKTSTDQILSKIKVPLKWYRVDIEEVARGGFLISVYGEKE